ncbi:3-methyl-2-oxobutanoate hydroxymethyltransferase [Halobacillus andaensis]|uniref:3-methyl-2-oxobutanoate hydroxymethyltransferase n=1 Tax=Halobacillus andaensis TaxID=1176239 RepID=UPI003D713D1F
MLTKTKIMKMKAEQAKITMLTAYDYPSAMMAEQAGTDMILVGDSLGMVVLGYESTIPVTVEDMVHHGKAVRRGARNTFVVVDMPFMSYHVSTETTLMNAKKIFQETEAQALKVEGAGEVVHTIHLLTSSGIPVVGHLGLTPQSVHVLGGYKVQGKEKETAQKMINDAKQIQEAGAVALVLECVPKELAELISAQLEIPTIGIGAGAGVDGQVLVYHDLLKYGVDRIPKFVKPYFNSNEQVTSAINSYVKEVKSGAFPGEEHTFTMDSSLLPKR